MGLDYIGYLTFPKAVLLAKVTLLANRGEFLVLI